MPLNPQNDSGSIIDADSYISLADADAMANVMGLGIGSSSESDREVALKQARLYIDSAYDWAGVSISEHTRFPVLDACSTGIPNVIKQMSTILMVAHVSGSPIYDLSGDGRQLKKLKTDVGSGNLVTEEEYYTTTTHDSRISGRFFLADDLALMSGLLKGDCSLSPIHRLKVRHD